MRKTLLLLTLSAFAPVATLVTALALPQFCMAQQVRQLPADGKRGVTGNPLMLPQVIIGRDTLALAPGGVIFDTYNRTIVHASLPVGADVWYQLNSGGQIQRIYILRTDEQARLDQAK